MRKRIGQLPVARARIRVIKIGLEYVIVVGAPAYPVSPDVFATESVFARHLEVLREQLASRFQRLHLIAPRMPEEEYQKQRTSMKELRSEDGFSFCPMPPGGTNLLRYWMAMPTALPRMFDTIRRSEVVHAGLSSDLYRPIGFLATMVGLVQKKRSIFVVDIDFRKSAAMNYETKRWSRKSYLICTYVYDPLRAAQIRLASRFCSLVLLKSPRMVEAFGGGRPNVKDFFDTAHDEENIIGPDAVAARRQRLSDGGRPIRLVYFGRLVPYKGVDRTLEAVARARTESGRDFRLDIIGSGDDEARLRGLVGELGLKDAVTFHPAVPYGPALFGKLMDADLMLATPLSEDTPRSAFDALSAGLPIVAFDLSYYQDLEASEAVITVRWPDVGAVAAAIRRLDSDREQMKRMVDKAVAFAHANTQSVWIDRRMRWTWEMLDGAGGATPVAASGH